MSTLTLREAAEILTEHFTSSIGISAQPYDTVPGQTDSDEMHAARLHRYERREMAKHDAVAGSIASMSAADVATLRSVFSPVGAGFICEDEVHAGRLLSCLKPRNGHGSFVRLALASSRAHAAFAKAYPDDAAPTSDEILGHLVKLANADGGRQSLFAQVREECSIPLAQALEAFRVVHGDRLAAARLALRDARAADRARSGALLEEMLGVIRRREQARFERRTRRAA